MTWCFVIWCTSQLKSVHWLESNPDWRVFFEKCNCLLITSLIYHFTIIIMIVILPVKVMRTCKMCYDIRTSQKYRATKLPLWALQILIIFFPFLGLLLKETIIKHSIFFLLVTSETSWMVLFLLSWSFTSSLCNQYDVQIGQWMCFAN